MIPSADLSAREGAAVAALSPSPCLPVHALCDHLAEVQNVLSLIASHPATPDDVRGRCLGLWYKLHDAHLQDRDALELRR